MHAVPKTKDIDGTLREIFEEDIASPITITLSTVREKRDKLLNIPLTVMQIRDKLRHIKKKEKIDHSTMYTDKTNNGAEQQYKWYLHGGKTTMLYLNLSGHDIF